MKNVYPVYSGPNVQFIPGIPAVPRLGVTAKEAEALIATGAFTYDEPPQQADTQTEGPAPAGPLDSSEE